MSKEVILVIICTSDTIASTTKRHPVKLTSSPICLPHQHKLKCLEGCLPKSPKLGVRNKERMERIYLQPIIQIVGAK